MRTATKGTSTPWGVSQTADQEAIGIMHYTTASHGGYHVSSKLNKEIPEVFRAADGWYEEDCAWAVVFVFLSCYMTNVDPKVLLQANDTIRRWYPHEWQAYNGVEITNIPDLCWDCGTGNCAKAGITFPRTIQNTGYGKYRVICQQESISSFHTKTLIKGVLARGKFDNDQASAIISFDKQWEAIRAAGDAYELGWSDYKDA